jgi:pimeloyl-ACP methyl ester carboxylesterase
MQSNRHQSFWSLLLVAALMPVSFCGASQVVETSSTTTPTSSTATPTNQSCVNMKSADFARVEDAPAQILDAVVVQADGPTPSYCRVQGYVMPQVRFEIHLPMSNWNGKLLEVGDGGWGGDMFLFFCTGPLRKGYACIASDMGHTGASQLALWARNNIQAQVDFGYRATHVTALIGKEIVRTYYGKLPAKSMMFGCSTGGYQGMVEAQRFPWDFDGIVAIAPDMGSEADLSMRIVWKLQQLADKDGHAIFQLRDLQLLHNATLRACDLSDGVKDGVIGDPVGCRFDPSVLACTDGHHSECLNVQQVRAAKNIYAGPTTSTGVKLSTRGLLPGTELDWDETKNSTAEVAEFFKYVLFNPSPGPDWTIRDFNFDHDYQRMGMGALFTDGDPDLRKFKTAGAKLLVAQGGGDPLEFPGGILDYYETVKRTMGGAASTQDFFRLFVIPGMKHCSGGDGAFAVDYLSYLEAWVDHNHPPDRMVGAHVDAGYLLQHSEDDGSSSMKDRIWFAAVKLPIPLDADAPVTFTRPVYPYPLLTRYKGTGDPNDAKNFGPVEPSKTAAQ